MLCMLIELFLWRVVLILLIGVLMWCMLGLICLRCVSEVIRLMVLWLYMLR